MTSTCSLWKVVTFFGKEHVNWSSISGVIMGRSWKIEFGKLKIGVTKKIVQLLPIITLLILDQFTCSLPKNVTTFQRQQDELIHFCLSPNIRGVLALWIYICTKMIMTFSNFIAHLYSNCKNTPFIGTEIKMNDSILLPVKSSYIF